jgi:hypothetical protein
MSTSMPNKSKATLKMSWLQYLNHLMMKLSITKNLSELILTWVLIQLLAMVSFKSLIFKGYTFILPLTTLILLATYFLRNIVITVVFADSFMPMEAYFLPQLIGDFFKIVALDFSFFKKYKSLNSGYQ